MVFVPVASSDISIAFIERKSIFIIITFELIMHFMSENKNAVYTKHATLKKHLPYGMVKINDTSVK